MEKKERKTLIGGQAVLEGVMMRGAKSMAIAVRDADGIIRVETKRLTPPKSRKIPIIRGIVSFVQSLFCGTAVLLRSAEVYGEGEPSKFEKWLSEKLKIGIMSVVGTISLLLGLGIAILLFMFLPQQIRIWLVGENANVWAKNLIEGGLKIVVFILYILLCSFLKDIRRTFMYHGAEHKTIACYEKGLALTPENAMKCSRVHDRCGTTFIFFVMMISIILFALFEGLLVQYNISLKKPIRIICKLAFLPLVAGLSYELLKGLAKTKSKLFLPLKAPGLLLQRITTREPTSDMLEVAITSFNAVLEMDSDESVKERKFVVSEKRRDLIGRIKEELKESGIDENAEAEWIVALTLNIKRSEVYSEELVTPKYVEKINGLVAMRKTGRPLWYCIGDVDFYGYKLKVDERVLIPRPETELLVENSLKDITCDSRVLDLCTGSGAIAIAIKKKSNATVVASDISKEALELASENSESNEAEITFIESDMFNAIVGEFDVIVSNPPYVESEEIKALQKEVKDYEPVSALDGGVDGLDFYRIIAKESKKHLKQGGIIYLEVGDKQAERVKELFSAFTKVEIIKDYENIDRIIRAVL